MTYHMKRAHKLFVNTSGRDNSATFAWEVGEYTFEAVYTHNLLSSQAFLHDLRSSLLTQELDSTHITITRNQAYDVLM